MTDPFEDFEYDLDPDHLSGDLASFELPLRSGGDDRFLTYLGLYDLLARRAIATQGEGAEAHLARLGVRIQGLEGPMRYALYEWSQRTESLSRAARLTSGESRLKREWLIPKLVREISLYNRRINALRSALESS